MSRFFPNPYRGAPKADLPPRTGFSRYWEVFWDHLGAMLLLNLVCFAGFLALALGVSLGLIYENFWLTLLGGILGGAIACPVFTASLTVVFRFFRDCSGSWPSWFRERFRAVGFRAAAEGACMGGLTGALLSISFFFLGLVQNGSLPAPLLWGMLGIDFFLLALGIALLVIPLALENRKFSEQIRYGLSVLQRYPRRSLTCAVVLLLWCSLGVALFPVSVPFAAAVGFWPVLLLAAQLCLPLAGPEMFTQEETAPTREPPPKSSRLGLILGILLVLTLVLYAARAFLPKEPDLQIAVVHRNTLPDGVSSALERSLGALVGDQNGDGRVQIQINDYTVVFDGTAENADVQAAGLTGLVTDLSLGESCLFLVEDPEGFLSAYADQVDGDGMILWAEHPVFSGMDAGSFSTVLDIDAEYTGQELLARYAVFTARNGQVPSALLP